MYLWGYSPQTPASCPKSLTKTFKLGCSANIDGLTVERRHYGKKIAPSFKVFERWGTGKKSFFKKFSSPPKKHKIHNPAFSLAREAQRKSLAKRKRRFMGLLAPNPRKFFEKNLTKNFQTLVRCKHRFFNRRAQALWQKNKTPVSKFLKDGVRERKAFFKKFSSPH